MAPFAKTGGLGDVVASLADAVKSLGYEVSVFLPRYRCVDISKYQLKVAVDYFEIAVGSKIEQARILKAETENGVKVYFVDHPDYFMRENLYGTATDDYPDNDRRFVFFQLAVLKGISQLKLAPNIINCHDWQTGLIPTYLKVFDCGYAPLKEARTVFTVHNLAYQGLFPPDSFLSTGLGWELYKPELLEFYGKFSFLKGGLVFADEVTTVSERYSREIQTKEFGCGMEGVLLTRKDSVTGIVNGINPKDWDPATDTDIDANFDLENIEEKKTNKVALQKENNFSVDESIPVVGFVSRLVEQKGLDILMPVIRQMAEAEEIQFVLLGTGENQYHQALRDIARKNKKNIGIHIVFDSKMAKKIYAGADMLLVPSYYEPCGLGQIVGLRYGTIPIVHAAGSLADTIVDFDIKQQTGNGFIFEKYSSDALHESLLRAVKIFKQKKLWQSIIRNAMERDFSWNATAKKYIELYKTVKRRTLETIKK